MKNMKNSIPDNGSIREYQHYITDVLTQRGFIHQDVNTRFVLLAEEMGELAKALRKSNKERTCEGSSEFALREELADVFFVLLSIANKCDVDLSDAFAEKEEKNFKRVWR